MDEETKSAPALEDNAALRHQAFVAVKALLSKVVGGPGTLVVEEVEDAAPGAGEVRVRVAACALNYPDALVIEDRYQVKQARPFSPGGEVSGTIDAVGTDVTGLRPGDRVIAWPWVGGLRQRLVVAAERCIPMPPDMPMEDGAALLLTYGTAHHALFQRGNLQPGERLLVTGAAGGVGLAAVELGAAVGAVVVAAASSQEKLDVALARGASRGIIYPPGALDKEAERAFSNDLKNVVGQGGADVILDVVGGDYTQACLRAIAWQGRHLVVGFPAGIPRLPLNLVLLKGCQVIGVLWGDWILRNRPRFEVAVQELFTLYRQGRIKPHIGARFPLTRAAEAIALLAGRRAVGKIVVTME